ncbi:ATP-binding protein [Runella aurantiaca]|nr:ATP-binding protein [Runella aurantiaca]
MKLFFLSFLMAFLSGAICFAQSRQEIDSLKHELSIAKHDTNRVLILVELAVSYQNTNTDSALKYGQKALDLAQKIKFLRGQARAFHRLGSTYRVIGDLPQALSLIYNGLQISEENHFYYESTRGLNSLGLLFLNLNDGTKAVNYLQQALKSNQLVENSEEKEEANVLIMSNIGRIYLERNQLDSVVYYFRKAQILDRKGILRSSPSHISNLGQIEFLLGNGQKAMEYSQKAIQLCKQNNDHRTAGTVYGVFANYFKELNQPDSAIHYSKIGLVESQSIDFKDGILRNSRLLAELYESRDIQKAYEYQKIATTTNEDLYGAKKIQVLQKTIVDEIDRQRQMEVELVTHQNQLKQYAFLAGLGVLLLIAFILYRTNKQQKRVNHLLHRQKEEINHQRDKAEKTLTELKSTQSQLIQKEKLASLGELTAGIAHEIQNPLNFVNNFSELSVELVSELLEERNKEHGERDEELEKELLNDLAQNQEKINLHGKRASSIVKGMLEHSRQSTGERELTDINQLADEYLRLAYHGFRAKDKDGSATRFNSEYELIMDKDLPKIEVVPQEIGRVLLNLINNAFYAVNARRDCASAVQNAADVNYSPKVVVSTQVVDNQVVIQVKDNGVGMSKEVQAKIFQPFFTTKPTGKGTGLGLSLAYDIVTKGHGGTIECESVEGEGTTFIVTLPIQNS